MIKERFQELVDFAKTESPYKLANKGWVNKDIFLQFGAKSKQDLKRNEFAKVSLFWSPINQLILSIFSLIFIASTFVIISVSLASNRFHFDIGTSSMVNNTSENITLQKPENTLVQEFQEEDSENNTDLVENRTGTIDDVKDISVEIDSDSEKSSIDKLGPETTNNQELAINSQKASLKQKSNLF